MIEHADGLQSPACQRVRHGGVVGEFVVVETPGLRLNAAPLDAEQVGRVPELAREVKIRFKGLGETCRRVRALPIPDAAGTLLPTPPVAVEIAPFHLVRGTRRAPEEPIRKGEHA